MIGYAVFARLSTMGDEYFDPVENRVYPHDVPPEIEPVYPLVVYRPDTQKPSTTHDDGPDDLYSVDVRIAALCDSETDAVEVGDLILNTLHKQGGNWGGIDVSAAFIQDGSTDTYQLVNIQPTLWVWEATFAFWAKR